MFIIRCHTATLFDIKRTHPSTTLNVFEVEKSICIELPILNLGVFSITYAETFFHSFSKSFRKHLMGKGVLALKSTSNSSERYIFTAYITRKDGTRIYARQYGLKAFRIPVK